MFTFVIRKLIARPWMPLVLFLGIALAAALVCTVPIYTNGILTRLLVLDLQDFQRNRFQFPGSISVKTDLRLDDGGSPESRAGRLGAFLELDRAVAQQLDSVLGKPILSRTFIRTRQFMRVAPGTEEMLADSRKFLDIVAMPGLPDHAQLLHGRMFSTERKDEVFEVVLTEEAIAELDLTLDREYVIRDGIADDGTVFRMKPVGVITVGDPNDPWWQTGISRFNESVFMHGETFMTAFLPADRTSYFRSEWFWAYDYHRFTADDVPVLISSYNRSYAEGRLQGLEVRLPVLSILEGYESRRRQLTLILWMILTPVMFMLGFFLSMVAKTFLEHEKNEIAVLKSRGAGTIQVFLGYLLIGLLLAVPATVVAPFLGLLFCSILGAADGFLQFVHRKRLEFFLPPTAWLFAAGAAFVSLCVILAPAAQASRTTIVEHKRARFRSDGVRLAGRVFIDLLFLGVAAYGLFQYAGRKQALQVTGAEVLDFSIDPVLFVSATCFLLGIGLLLLRVYPLLVRLLFALGKDRWSPVLFASLIQVGRAGGSNRSLMLFLIVSLGTGVFNADSARTLNTHAEDRERYLAGAPVAIQERWETTEIEQSFEPGESAAPVQSAWVEKRPSKYLEPDFRRFAELSTVESYTKVYRKDRAAVRTPDRKQFGNITLIAVVPHEFGRVAWSRRDLAPYHLNTYLNLLARGTQGALVGRPIMEQYKLSPGDTLSIKLPDQPEFEVIIYGTTDFWPSYNPHLRSSVGSPSHLIVMNLPYLQAMTSLEPYEVWLDPKPGTTSAALYEDFAGARIQVAIIRDASQEIIRAKNDPMLLGMNGALTWSFLMSMGISLAGFLMYWSFAIKERNLQFGVFRAMGLSKWTIFAMIGAEQVLVSGTAVALGLLSGTVASRLYVPLLEVTRKAEQQILPFRVVSLSADRLRVLAVVLLMLLAGCLMLGVVVSRMKIHEAVKLGEE